MSVADAWLLYTHSDPGFLTFLEMVIDRKVDAMQEAHGGGQ